MILLKTKKGVVITSNSDFQRIVTRKNILRRGRILKDKKWIPFYEFDFQLKFEDILDWYDFEGILELNAEKIIELIDKEILKVRDGNIK